MLVLASLKNPRIVIPAAIAAVLVVLFLSIPVVASLCGPDYVNENGEALIGRRVNVESLSLNPFNGDLTMKDFTIYEKDGETRFVSFDALDTKVKVWKLLLGTADMHHLHVDGLFVNVEQADTVFNFSDIMERFASDDDDSEGLPVVIGDIQLTNAAFHYKDKLTGSHYDIEHFALSMPGVDLRDANADMGLKLAFTDGGELTTQLKQNQNGKDFVFSINVKDFSLQNVTSLMEGSMNGSLDGMLQASIDVKGNMDHLLDMKITGKVNAYDVVLEDEDGNEAFKTDSVYVGIRGVDITHNRVSLDHFVMSSPEIYYTVDEDTIGNFSRIFTVAEDVAETEDEAPQMKLVIDRLAVSDGVLHYVDKSLSNGKMQYDITKMQLWSNNFSLTSRSHLELTAQLASSGDLRFAYDGRPDDIGNSRIMLRMHNVDMTDFTPFSIDMFARPIESGTMALDSYFAIVDEELNGDLGISIYQPEVGKRDKSIDAPFKRVSLKSALYVLTDRDGNCRMDIPVSGRLDEPSFSVRRLALRVLGKFFGKVALSPFHRSRGDRSDASHVEFESLRAGVDARGYQMLDTIAAYMEHSPATTLRLELNVNEKAAEKEVPATVMRSIIESHITDVKRYLTTQKGIDKSRIEVVRSATPVKSGKHYFDVVIESGEDDDD